CRIKGLETLDLHPGAKVFHYAQEIFEGFKAYRQGEDVVLFRPQENIKRMTESAKIMSMPPFPEEDFFKTLKEMVAKSRDLVPKAPGSLYIRPTMIGMTPTLGVAPAKDYIFFILLSPVGGYFGNVAPDKPFSVSLWISPYHVRAVRGGVGSAK